MKEVIYEGYGPQGSAFLIKTITSNTNRTSSAVRTLLTKYSGVMAEIGAVAWQFQEKGWIVVDGVSITYADKGREKEKIEPFDPEKLELELMELAISDISIEEGIAEISTEKADFMEVRNQVITLGYHIAEADIYYVAENTVDLSGEEKEKFLRIYEALSEDDDVDHVYHNVKEN
jgi:transcriptional/translational regulatory protein YebC/TACO1